MYISYLRRSTKFYSPISNARSRCRVTSDRIQGRVPHMLVLALANDDCASAAPGHPLNLDCKWRSSLDKLEIKYGDQVVIKQSEKSSPYSKLIYLRLIRVFGMLFWRLCFISDSMFDEVVICVKGSKGNHLFDTQTPSLTERH